MGDIYIQLKKQHLIILGCIIGIFGIVLMTNAFNNNFNSDASEASDLGHSADEVAIEFGGNVKSVQQIFNENDFATENWVDSQDYATESWTNNNFYTQGETDNKFATESWVNNQDYATESYVDNNRVEGCTWSGWKPDTIEGEDYCYCGCKDENSQTQLYCEDGEITDVKNREYCTACDTSCMPCFVLGTKVLMLDGNYEDIEKIKSGDYIINENGEKDKVLELREHEIGERNTYIINDKIETTPDHPFMTEDGWKVISPERLEFVKEVSDYYQGIEATELTEGDVLITKEGKEVVETIEENSERPSEEIVYTLILENGEGFYAEDYLVADGE